MFGARTVFIVGAGASKELGLPLGGELLRKINGKLNNALRQNHDTETLIRINDLVNAGIDERTLFKAIKSMEKGLRQAISIDNYLFSHSDDADKVGIGKYLIAEILLESEHQSCLSLTQAKEFSSPHIIEKSWLLPFFQLLSGRINKSNIDNIFDNVSFISFNYDRFIKHYLKHSLVDYFGITHDKSHELISNLDVVHPYGYLGGLPWEINKDDSIVNFGARLYPRDRRFPHCNKSLFQLAKSILTFDEASEGIDEVRTKINNLIHNASKIVFLGFAYHDQNMDLLSGSGRDGYGLNIYGSSLGISDPATAALKGRLSSMFPGAKHINLSPLSAAQIFAHYQGLLS